MSANAGEICGIVGENGSGKSTFAGILTRLVKPDDGAVSLELAGYRHDLLQEGPFVSLVPQTPQFVAGFDAVDNIFLGSELGRLSISPLRRRRQAEMVAVWSEVLFRIPSGVPDNWKDADKQKVSIIRALVQDRPILIVDEIPSALDARDRTTFLRFLRRFADEGRLVLLISHQIREVADVCDNAFAFGRGIATRVEPVTVPALLSAIFLGLKDTSESLPEPSLGEEIMRISMPSDLAEHDGSPIPVRSGETVCFAGLAKSGQDELFTCLASPPALRGYKLEYRGQEISFRSTKWRRDRNMKFIPPDRARQGVVAGLTCEENLLLGFGSGVWWKKPVPRRDRANTLLAIFKRFQIAKAPSAPIESLSGGNQQKVLVARELGLGGDPRILVAYNPTVGIDIRTRNVIISEVARVAALGGAVILITTDIDEALALGGKCFVLKRGKIAHKKLPPIDRDDLVRAVTE